MSILTIKTSAAKKGPDSKANFCMNWFGDKLQNSKVKHEFFDISKIKYFLIIEF